jgi:translation initiation factor 2 beta subunit (eIF-2beta)/eIF-5
MNIGDLFSEQVKEDKNWSSKGVENKTELLNIQNIADEHARYRMPKLQSRIKDKGKFAETFVNNLVEIAAALKVPLAPLLKFMESELGSQFLKADKQDLASYYVKGRFEYEQLYKPLRLFIDEYVLCSKCNLPELRYQLEKNKGLRVCSSCGLKQTVDVKHKIIKHLFDEIPKVNRD